MDSKADIFIEVMKDKTNYFTESQIERMIDSAPNEDVKLLVYLLYHTGRRISELLQLKVEHIAFDDGMILFNILKKRKPMQKWFAIDKKALETLLYHIKQYCLEPNQYIFLSNKANKDGNYTRYTRKWAFDNIRKLTSALNIPFHNNKTIKTFKKTDGSIIESRPGWHPHHLRHSFAINFLKKSNNNLKLCQLHLDHSNINITASYLEFNQEDRKKVLNQVFGDE